MPFKVVAFTGTMAFRACLFHHDLGEVEAIIRVPFFEEKRASRYKCSVAAADRTANYWAKM
jgi:hypothetical protein